MTPWISARRADDFESQVRSGDARSSADADLLELVGALRTMESTAPRPEFLADLRERLMVEAADVLVASPSPAPAATDRLLLPERNPRKQRRLVAAVGTAVLVGTGSTMAVASQSALPGDSLYSIKRLVEGARSSVAFSDSAKGQQALDRATARLDEAAALVGKGGSGDLRQVPDTLDTFVSQSREGADALLADFTAHGDDSSVERVRAFASASLDRLMALKQSSPDSVFAALSQAARTMIQIDSSAAALCPTCTGGLPPEYGVLLEALENPGSVVGGPQDNLPDAGTTPDDAPTSVISALPTIHPSTVAQALASQRATSQLPTAGPSQPVQPGSSHSTGPGTGGPSGQPTSNPSKNPVPSSSPSPGTEPTTAAPVLPPVTPLKDLTDLLLGTDDQGKPTGVVNGLLDGVGGLLGGIVNPKAPKR